MRSFIATILLVLCMSTPALAGNDNPPNPCGNHGNNCCTEDAGSTFVSVSDTCEAFCSSTSFAVSVAVSECEAKASASCKQECGDAVALAVNDCEAKATAACRTDADAFAAAVSKSVSVAVAAAEANALANCQSDAALACSQECGIQVANAVAKSTAECAQTCSVPLCLKWRIRRNPDGTPRARICVKTSEQPIEVQ